MYNKIFLIITLLISTIFAKDEFSSERFWVLKLVMGQFNQEM